MTPTPAERAALKAAHKAMRLPADPIEAEDIALRDLIETEVDAALKRHGYRPAD